MLAAGLTLGVAPGHAAYPGDNGKLACEGTRPISAMEPPAGISRSEVYTINPDGTGETVLTDNEVRDGDPSFSPDGRNLTFETFRDGFSEVYRMGVDGSSPLRLTSTNDKNTENRGTSWSPDGTKIVFHSTRDALPPGSPPGSSRFEIYTMNADGTNQTRITNNLAQDSLPAWSPDGKRIAFTTTRDRDFEIYTMNPDGTDVVRVTNSPGQDVGPAWSPDGKQLAFQSTRAGSLDVYRQSADGSGIATRLTGAADESEYFPTWSPDGKRIAYNGTVPGDPAGNIDVYTISAVDGSDLTRVTTAPGFDGRCDWQTLKPAAVVVPPPVTTTTVGPSPAPVRVAVPVPLVADRTAPAVSVSGVHSSMSLKSFLKGVRVRVTRSEAASIAATLDAVAGRGRLIAGFNVSLARKSVARGTSTTTILLKPSRKLVGRAKRFRARVAVVVTDTAGNRRTVTRSIKVRR